MHVILVYIAQIDLLRMLQNILLNNRSHTSVVLIHSDQGKSENVLVLQVTNIV